MSAYNPATDSPPAIDTLEKALAHLLLLSQDLYKGMTYQEIQGSYLERVIDASMVRAADGTTRLIGRVSIPIDESYVTATAQKLWTFANTISDAAVPAAYKVD